LTLEKTAIVDSSTPDFHKQRPTGKRKLSQLPELDSLRTVAVALVLLTHYLPGLGWPAIPYAWYGVDIFFTISGFLITSNLILSTENRGASSKLSVIKNFMIRRVFRLFPIYYLFLFTFYFLKHFFHVDLWRDDFTPYFFTYTPNWLFFRTGLSDVKFYPHLWSLGVEEQFYLAWPWLLLYTPRNLRLILMAVLIVIALACSFGFLIYGNDNLRLLPFANFHTLGAGALLAYFYTKRSTVIEWLERNRFTIFVLSTVHLIAVLVLYKDAIYFLHFYRELSLCVCTFSMVLVSVFGWSGVVRAFTTNGFVQYLGRISYGIYLFHLAVPTLLGIVLTRLTIRLPNVALFLSYLLITFVAAAVSYKYVETPFLRLKKRFEH
jgi:peptidoglycan/LPS O-acetylase OafA/YrhL